MDFKNEARHLFTFTSLELFRVKETHADPREIGEFKDLEDIISHSLRKPNLIRTQTLAGNTRLSPKLENREFKDEALLQKLVQYRDRIPLSGRIIRKQEP